MSGETFRNLGGRRRPRFGIDIACLAAGRKVSLARAASGLIAAAQPPC
jgi:hypothetical protein